MVAEQIKAKLEEILNPDTILDRKKRVVHVFNEFEDEDNTILAEITNTNIVNVRLEELAILIGSRFGKVIKSPTQTGSTNTYYLLVQPENSKYILRVKGFNNLPSIEQNIQHINFLKAKKESGFNASIGYGPSLENPLYIVMLQGESTTITDFKNNKDVQEDRDPLPKALNNILDFLGSYALNQGHIGPSENILSHIELVGTKMLDELLNSYNLNQNRKDYWADRISRTLEDMKAHIRGDEVSTWVASDPIIENFVKVRNGGDKETFMFIDQGYFPSQVNAWKSRIGLNSYNDVLDKMFSGRIEYNIGQMYYSLMKMDNLDKLVIDRFRDRMLTLVAEGRYNGGDVRQGRFMPDPSNLSLSTAYVNLGILVPIITDIARRGETSAMKAYAKRLTRHISDGHPFGLQKDLFTDVRGKSFTP